MSDKLSVKYLQSIMVISKIKYGFFYLGFLLFQSKKFITSCWSDEKKNTKPLNWFYVLNIVFPLK